MEYKSCNGYHWSDTKRILGMPISCTHYSLSDTALHITRGLLNQRTTDILLYRIDVSGHGSSILQRMVNQGTITIKYLDNDQNWKTAYIENIKHPEHVKDKLLNMAEESKLKHRRGYGFPPYPTDIPRLPH